MESGSLISRGGLPRRRNNIALATLVIASVGILGNCIDRRLKRIAITADADDPFNRELASLLLSIYRRFLRSFLLGTFSYNHIAWKLALRRSYCDYNRDDAR